MEEIEIAMLGEDIAMMMNAAKSIHGKVTLHRNDIKNYKLEIEKAQNFIKAIQNNCPHEPRKVHERGDAQDRCWSECLACGKELPG